MKSNAAAAATPGASGLYNLMDAFATEDAYLRRREAPATRDQMLPLSFVRKICRVRRASGYRYAERRGSAAPPDPCGTSVGCRA